MSKTTLLSFGGAYSNHITAVAAAGSMFDFKTIGIIRGEELGFDIEKTLNQNSTLRFAKSKGMQLVFVSRSDYRKKEQLPLVKKLIDVHEAYVIPEGGTNALAVKGCEEILSNRDNEFDVICSSLGTSGTFSGLVKASKSQHTLLGFPALKGDFFSAEIATYTTKSNWDLSNYHFGGYAKYNLDLIQFINGFKRKYGIQLDPIYTAKMMYGIFDLIKTGYFSKNTRILAIHTGGLQAIDGFNKRLAQKNDLQLI